MRRQDGPRRRRQVQREEQEGPRHDRGPARDAGGIGRAVVVFRQPRRAAPQLAAAARGPHPPRAGRYTVVDSLITSRLAPLMELNITVGVALGMACSVLRSVLLVC